MKVFTQSTENVVFVCCFVRPRVEIAANSMGRISPLACKRNFELTEEEKQMSYLFSFMF